MPGSPGRDAAAQGGFDVPCNQMSERTHGIMITEIIVFDQPDGATRDEVVANYRQSTSSWRAHSDLIRQNYLNDSARRNAGAVCTSCATWKSRDVPGMTCGSKASVAHTTVGRWSGTLGCHLSWTTVPAGRWRKRTHRVPRNDPHVSTAYVGRRPIVVSSSRRRV